MGQEQNELDGIPRIAYKTFDYVIRRLNALSTALKSRLKGLTFGETPLARSPDSPGVPFRANLEQATLKTSVFMKFLNLKTKRDHQRGDLDELPRAAFESLSKPYGIPHQAHTYSELRQQIHDDLRNQHPEWVKPNGECPMCDAYEARLIQLFDHLGPNADNESVAARHPNFEHVLN